MRIRIAQLLAWHGSSVGVPVLIDSIVDTFRGGFLPPRTSQIRYTQLPPDHGAMPKVVYLLYSLGMTADMRSIPVWEQIAELIEPTEENFRDRMAGTFHYVEAVCYGAEILGAPEAIPALRRFHSFPTLRGLVVIDGIEPDFVQERRALLELGLGRAMARCGDTGGFDILIGFLDDSRRTLAEYAHCQLKTITTFDMGKSSSLWREWLDWERDAWQPRPLLIRQDT